jgi:hypothetical protein
LIFKEKGVNDVWIMNGKSFSGPGEKVIGEAGSVSDVFLRKKLAVISPAIKESNNQ